MVDEPEVAAFTALVVGLFGKLKAKGLLSDLDLKEVFELATLGFEEMGLDQNPTAAQAHAFLRSIQKAIWPTSPKPDAQP